MKRVEQLISHMTRATEQLLYGNAPEKIRIQARGLISGMAQPEGKADAGTTTRIFKEFYKHALVKYCKDLPYAKKAINALDQAGLLEVAYTDPDHVANRHFIDRTVPALDHTRNVPQFSLLSGRKQTALPLAMLGLQDVGTEMNYPERAASGQGQIRRDFEGQDPLPRAFSSEQDLAKLPPEFQAKLKEMQRNTKNDFTLNDWKLLIRIDQGEKLSETECHQVAHNILPKIYGLKHVKNPKHAVFFRQQEKAGDTRAEFTANAYENGQRINHFAIAVTDVVKASHLLKGLGYPMVADQGIGTPLQQSAVQSMGFLSFLEIIHRDQVIENGIPQFQANGQPKRIENAFNLNANAIFAATATAVTSVAKTVQLAANHVYGHFTDAAVKPKPPTPLQARL